MSSKGRTRPAWMNKELLTKLEHIKKVYKTWNQCQGTQEEYRVCLYTLYRLSDCAGMMLGKSKPTYEGQEDYWELSACIYKGEIMLDQPNSLLK